ncbi:MAG: B12-binding domain-containing protein, partial [Ilumatobacteraceae bacterium]
MALLDGWLDAGWPVTRILAEVVVPAQHEAGRRWQRGDWSISREHTVSSVIDTLVGVLGLRVSYDRATAPGAPVLVVCAEGEWHTLVARVIAEGLRAEGVPVHLLGGSVPARDLAAEAEDAGCSAAIVCCAVPMHLPGAQRSVAALREA